MRVKIVDRSAIGLLFSTMDDTGVSGMLGRLHEHQESLREDPLNILVLLFSELGRSSDQFCRVSVDEVLDIENQTRMTSMRISPEPVQKEYEHLTKDIHYCNVNLIGQDEFSNFEGGFGKFVKETLKTVEAARKKRGLEPDPHIILYQYIDYRLNVVEIRLKSVQCLQRRIQSQMSVVGRSPYSRTCLGRKSLIRF